ncbi:hypothetical protein Patl1_02034 [Pistacia atlantica]|uniref:Uncharacterized protein n=1 Tax=Pistacia atlantica TaxID=434234 RepID=A0ACC1CBG9_9ROSI|nr:hypothetical protein Patl1_02034 [Pistacia atlantica]
MRAQLILLLCLLFNCLCRFHCTTVDDVEGYISKKIQSKAMPPDLAPSPDPQPFLPLIAPSPLIPITNRSLPSLSGFCTLNFSAAASLMSTTATDCWDSFAPYLANVICCPQFDASLAILMGQYSKYSGMLHLDKTNARHCLSDFEMILESQGANNQLQKLCSIRPENLTEASCPVSDVKKFESIVDSSRLLAACGKIDPVNECCHQVCQNAILDAARKIARNGTSNWPENSTRIDDCKNIVFRWLASKLDPSSANHVLRGLSNCKLNKGCPLVFPKTINVTKECGYMISNQTACCKAMENYVSHLQKQSFITNLQGLNCAASLGMELQKANVSSNVYDLCHINLKDFSLQDSGCLLPSLPSDVTYDAASGIGFICDLNDNIEATWPVCFYSTGYQTSSTSYSYICSKWSLHEEVGVLAFAIELLISSDYINVNLFIFMIYNHSSSLWV